MIPILLQTEDILAVNKPEGLAAIHSRGKDSLLSMLEVEFGGKLYVVHRLDREVSGVMLLARNAEAHRFLNLQFDERTVRKTYLALVHGAIRDASGVINRPLREFGSGRMGVDTRRGKPSVTKFGMEKRFRDYTLVKAYPLTSRRHQIRVHLYSIGHPIVGDRRYGEPALQAKFPRLMLHACSITLRLPSGEEITVEAPLPASFTSALRTITGRPVD